MDEQKNLNKQDFEEHDFLWELSEKGDLSELEKNLFLKHVEKLVIPSTKSIDRKALMQNCQYNKALSYLIEAKNSFENNMFNEAYNLLDEAEFLVFYNPRLNYDHIVSEKQNVLQKVETKLIEKKLENCAILADSEQYESYFIQKNLLIGNHPHNKHISDKLAELELAYKMDDLEDFLYNVDEKFNLAKDYFSTQLYADGLNFLFEAKNYLEQKENKFLLNDFNEKTTSLVKNHIDIHLSKSYDLAEHHDIKRTDMNLGFVEILNTYITDSDIKKEINHKVNRVSTLCYQNESIHLIDLLKSEGKKDEPDHRFINTTYNLAYDCRDRLVNLASNMDDITFINNFDRNMVDIRFDIDYLSNL